MSEIDVGIILFAYQVSRSEIPSTVSSVKDLCMPLINLNDTVFHFTRCCLSSCFCAHELKDSGLVALDGEALDATDIGFRWEGERS